MRESWLTPQWNGRRRIAHPVNWARLPEFDVGVAFVQTKVAHGHENRWYLYCRKFNEADVQAVPVLASTVITASPGTTQTITSDATWDNSSANSVEVIGAGARGAHGASTSTSGGGGGGGAYTQQTNVTIPTPGTTPMYVRVGGTTATDGTAGGDSWWTLTSPGTSYPGSGTAVGARGGAALVSATTATGGVGGGSSTAYPNTATAKTSGGNGGTAGALSTSGGGGGGAAGVSGAGVSAGSGPSAGGAGNAGAGGGGTGGAVGSPGSVGGTGTNIDGVVGSGGGGGGGNASPSTGGAGGLYGGGGGGGGRSTGTGGQGRQGVIVLTWTPLYTGTLTVTEAPDVAAFPGGKVAWNAALAATEAADIAAFTGSALQPVTGSLAVTEAAETAALAALVAWNAVLAASEDTTYELLLHLDGIDGSTTITDSGGKNQTVTAHGTAQIDADQAVFAGQALLLSADSDYLSVDTGDFAFDTGDFCVDLRTRLSSATAAQLFFDGGASGFQLLYDGSALKFTSAAGNITGSGLAADTNYHLAATRGAGSTRLFKDGVQQGSTLTDATSYGATAGYPRIGGPASPASISASLAATEVSDVASFTGSVVVGYDTATNAWITAVGSSNVDSAHAGYVDALIVGLKADGIWPKLDRLWIFAAQNSQSALIDLVALSSATAVNSPPFVADRGYTSSYSTYYVNTGFVPSTNGVTYTLNSAHYSAWSLTAAQSTQFTILCVGSSQTNMFVRLNDNNTYFRINNNASGGVANSDGTGFYVGNRSASGGAGCVLGYKNGSQIYSGADGSNFLDTTQIVILDRQIAATGVGGSLTATEQSNFYNRMRTYMTAVGVP